MTPLPHSWVCFFAPFADTVLGCSTEEELAESQGWKEHPAVIMTTITKCLRAQHYPES